MAWLMQKENSLLLKRLKLEEVDETLDTCLTMVF
jgi:hypothetical protein